MSGSFTLTTNQSTSARKTAAILRPICSVNAAATRRLTVFGCARGAVIQTSMVADHSRRTRNLQTEQLSDERAIALRAPVVFPDPLLSNRAFASDDERLRIA